jgi:hypothetical protein
MFPYNTKDFDPPAPAIEAQVTAPLQSSPVQQVEMQLDSGADMTCIPKSVIPNLRNLRYGSVGTEDFDGHSATKRTCFLCLSFAGFDFKDIEAIEIEGSFGLIGRDVLNELRLILDGRKRSWHAE